MEEAGQAWESRARQRPNFPTLQIILEDLVLRLRILLVEETRRAWESGARQCPIERTARESYLMRQIMAR